VHRAREKRYITLTRLRDTHSRVEIIDFPDFDVSHTDSDQLVAHPCHSVNLADALVAGMECSCTCAGVYVPDVQEAVVGRTQACEEAGVRTEGYAVDTERVIRERCERRI
jgi:hypothetical protein